MNTRVTEAARRSRIANEAYRAHIDSCESMARGSRACVSCWALDSAASRADLEHLQAKAQQPHQVRTAASATTHRRVII